MELSCSWEATFLSSAQEFAKILWKPKVHHPVDKTQPLVPVLSCMTQSVEHNPISSTPTFNVILSCTSRCCWWSPSFWLPHKNFLYTHILLMCAKCSARLIVLELKASLVQLSLVYLLKSVAGNENMPFLCCRWEEQAARDQTDNWWVFRHLHHTPYSVQIVCLP
jgi:hypothetical protein